jgi:Sulfatase
VEVNRITRRLSPAAAGSYPTQLLAVLLVVILVQVLELLLLQQKYDLFTGGFLQAYSYLTWAERGKFILLSLWVDIALFGAVSLPWFWVSRRLQARPLMAAYNFIFVCSLLMGAWLGLKFKVLSYFNDTLNFLVIKNLGGGSLLEAFSYIANEAAVFGAGLLVLLCICWIGLYWINRRSAHAVATIGVPRLSPKQSGWAMMVMGLLTIALMAFINSDASLRYGLTKKTSYALISHALDGLTDLDRDGHGLFRFPTDPKILDPTIYPGALDIPGNGLDEDGYAGDFNWEGPEPDPLARLSPIPGRHILLIVLESARGDLLDKTWQGRSVSPNITGLARTGTNVGYAYSHTGYTVSSIQALLNRTLSSSKDRVVLTDFLRRSGYSLSFISGQDESFGGVAAATGMDAPGSYLFDARSALTDRVYASKAPGSLRLSEDRIVRQFHLRTGEVDWKKPQFFYINLQAAHFPYSHPKMPAIINARPIRRSDISKENLTQLQATYWNAIAVADQAVGNMIERLKQLGVYEETVIAVVGDHGESLFDDDFLGHGHALNQAQTRIPLVISSPGLAIKGTVGQKDVAELLVRVATGRTDKGDWDKPERSQLQFVGSLNRPQLIGTVSAGDIRTILDLRTRKVFFSDLRRWEDFDKALNAPGLGQRTKELIELWERARWEDYLSRPKVQAKSSGR